MMNKVCLAAALFASCFLCGCFVIPFGGLSNPQSHFSYPNSNVTPLGTAQASSMGLTSIFGIPVGEDIGDMVNKTTNDAIQSKGGDLLINTSVTGKMITVVIVGFTEIKVSGTVAKMEIGKQELE